LHRESVQVSLLIVQARKNGIVRYGGRAAKVRGLLPLVHVARQETRPWLDGAKGPRLIRKLILPSWCDDDRPSDPPRLLIRPKISAAIYVSSLMHSN